MTYPGGKNGAGVYQKIINQMPKHRLYIEPFLGSGAIFKMKKPAEISLLSDADYMALQNFCIDIDFSIDRRSVDKFIIFSYNENQLGIRNSSALEAFESLRPYKNIYPGLSLGLDVLIYADPPYIAAECTPGRPLYKFDMPFADQHEEFLAEFVALPCMKMISHYKCALYDDMLTGWRQISYNSPTRGGWKTDTLYMSFPEPVELHDYQYLGDTYRKREKIKIKRQNWERKITNMPVLERSLLFEVMDNIRSGAHR